ncbi:MAG: T9SS type A sorting domain-containing protein [Flavobacteriales bacterium]
MTTPSLIKRLLVFIPVLGLGALATAQPVCDIDLRPNPAGDSLRVYMRANTTAFSGVMSALVFTVRWEAASTATLGNRTQFCAAGYSITAQADGEIDNGGYTYRTYSGFGFSNISVECPTEVWPANTWKLIMRIKVNSVDRCTTFNIVNDNFTSTGNKNYYLSLNGFDKTGTIESTVANSSPCGSDCSLYTQVQVTTDGAGAQTTWEIRSGNTVVCSGGPYANNSTITSNCCLSAGCYTLRVMDSFGDGMCCANGAGGYILSDGKGNRIINNNADGVFATLSKAPGTWCLPISSDGLKPTSCDVTVAANTYIQAIPNALVSAQWGVGSQTDDGYQFWFFDADGSFDRKLFRSHAKNNGNIAAGPERASYQKLSAVKNPSLPQGRFLNVRVRNRINGTYGAYGPACRIYINTNFSGAELADGQTEMEEMDVPSFTMFPNPLSEGALTVRLTGLDESDEVAQLEIYDMQGKRVFANTLAVIGGNSTSDVRLSGHTGPGVYLVVVSSNTQRFVQRLVVQ